MDKEKSLIQEAVEKQWQNLTEIHHNSFSNGIKSLIIDEMERLDDDGGIRFPHRMKSKMMKSIEESRFKIEETNVLLETLKDITRRYAVFDRVYGRDFHCSFIDYMCLTEGTFWGLARRADPESEQWLIALDSPFLGRLLDDEFSLVKIFQYLPKNGQQT